jgi:hypothetical protein
MYVMNDELEYKKLKVEKNYADFHVKEVDSDFGSGSETIITNPNTTWQKSTRSD